MVGKSEVGFGIVVANIRNHVTDEPFIVWQFAIFHVLADHIA